MLLAFVLLATSLPTSQDVPAGVRYKRASDQTNKVALQKLEKFYSADIKKLDLKGLPGEVVVLGPGLWQAMEKNAPKELKSAAKATFVVPNNAGVQEFEGRLAKTRDAKEVLLLAVKILARNKKPTIRKANADELRYYWAIIPYDIEEPLYIADFGNRTFLFDFDSSGSDPHFFHIDIVAPMK